MTKVVVEESKAVVKCDDGQLRDGKGNRDGEC